MLIAVPLSLHEFRELEIRSRVCAVPLSDQILHEIHIGACSTIDQTVEQVRILSAINGANDHRLRVNSAHMSSVAQHRLDGLLGEYPRVPLGRLTLFLLRYGASIEIAERARKLKAA